MRCETLPIKGRGRETLFGLRSEMNTYSVDESLIMSIIDDFVKRWQKKNPINQKRIYFVSQELYDFTFEKIRAANKIINYPIRVRNLDFHIYDQEDGDEHNIIHMFIDYGGHKQEILEFMIESETAVEVYDLDVMLDKKYKEYGRFTSSELLSYYNVNSKEREFFKDIINFLGDIINKREINAFGKLIDNYRDIGKLYDPGVSTLTITECCLVLKIKPKTFTMLAKKNILKRIGDKYQTNELRILEKFGITKGVQIINNSDQVFIE